MKRLFAVLSLFIVLAACNQSAAPGDSSAITARSAELSAAISAKDIDAAAAVYTEDARMLAPNAPMATGQDSVRAEFGALIDAGLSLKLTSIEAGVMGDMGHNVGTYVVSAGDAVVDVGKFIETWERGEDGVWRMSNDIYNSDNPPPGGDNEHLIILHEVDDAKRWLAAWRGDDSRHKLFMENGAAHVHTFRSTEKPNLTGLVISVSDMAALQEMLESDDGQAAAKEDGVRMETMQVFTEAE